MKIFVSVVFLSLLLFSCKEVSFREPQPSGIPALKEVPAILQGKYQTSDPATGEKADTLIIESWGYHFKDKEDKDWLGRGTISDSLVIKFYENYYFINFLSGDQWVLRLIHQKTPVTIEFLAIDIQDDSRRKELVKKLSRKYKLKEIKRNENTFYQITPTASQLMQLIKEGYFTGTDLAKIN